ncbi:SN protein, partial [Sagittarius serpentarius]|nr:SN protein [Sagittarius serpentarius]
PSRLSIRPSPPRASSPSPSTAAARVWISPSPDVQEGNAVNLTCAVESGGEEALSYTWYKNKVWFSTGSAPALTFPSVDAADAASYHCTVRTPARTRSSAPATLNVLCESPRAGGFTPQGGEVPGAH